MSGITDNWCGRNQNVEDEEAAEIGQMPGYGYFCQDAVGFECMQHCIYDLYALMFMILPTAIPSTIAA